jgi:cytochrome c oxidase cbb3-type subunit 3
VVDSFPTFGYFNLGGARDSRFLRIGLNFCSNMPADYRTLSTAEVVRPSIIVAMNRKFSFETLRIRCSRKLALPLMAAILWACTVAVYAQASKQPAPAAPPDDQQIAEAKKTFEATCAGCHGLDGRGGERGPNIATRQEVVRKSDNELFKILRNGIPASGMPSFASLGNTKLAAMLVYLRSLQGKGPLAAVPGNPKDGEALFFGAAHCSDCHMVQGKGGFIGPDLSVYAAASSVDEIKTALVSPGGRDPSRARGVVTITLHDGKRLEGIIRNEDNFSVQIQSLDGSFHLLQKSEVGEIARSQQSLMPADYGKTLSPSQLDDLVSYLMIAARKATEQPANKHNWEEESL